MSDQQSETQFVPVAADANGSFVLYRYVDEQQQEQAEAQTDDE